MRRSWRGSQQAGHEAGFGAALAQLAGNGAVVAGQGIRQCPRNSAHGSKYKCFNADAFCQGQMAVRHGGSLRLLGAANYQNPALSL